MLGKDHDVAVFVVLNELLAFDVVEDGKTLAKLIRILLNFMFSYLVIDVILGSIQSITYSFLSNESFHRPRIMQFLNIHLQQLLLESFPITFHNCISFQCHLKTIVELSWA